MFRILLVVAVVALNLYAFILCAQTEQENVKRLPKWAWLLLIALLQPFGAIGYLIWGRQRKQGPGRGGRRKVIGPDDDPDFLRNL
jgi:cytochrome bd-type quinol oxidase subunit 2